MKDMNEIPIHVKYRANKWKSYISMMQEPSGFPSFVGIQKLSEEGEPLEGNIYIPERTCINFYKHADSPRFWCSECDFKSNWPISDGRAIEPRHCPDCGAKVVE